jgi:hypothetical protein
MMQPLPLHAATMVGLLLAAAASTAMAQQQQRSTTATAGTAPAAAAAAAQQHHHHHDHHHVGATTPAVWWCSWAAPGRTMLLGASAVPTSADVTLTALPGGGESVTVSAVAGSDGEAAVTNSGSGLTVLVPTTLPRAAYRVQVDGAAPFLCGAPDVWWVQGGEGNASVAGGWLRAFGRNLALLPAGSALAERQRSVEAGQLAEQAARAMRRGDWAQAGDLAAAQVAVAKAAKGAHADAAINTTVTLCSTASKCTTLAADGSTSSWAAQFWLPQEMVPGEYSATISNGFASSVLDMFISTSAPHVSTVTVLPSHGRRPWATKIFDVSNYGCSGGFVQGQMKQGWNNETDNRTLAMNCSYQGLPYNCPRDCTGAARAAIAAAGAEPNNAGGVVYFGPGRWYLRAPFLLPDNVVLRGAGATQTGVLLAFENKTTAPRQIIGAASSTTQGVRFAVEDITFWHTTYYQTFIDISANTDGVRIRNVNIRANMFTWAWDTEGSDSKFVNVHAPRQPTWDLSSNMHSHELISTHSHNFEVSGCDLWATSDLFGSGSATSDGYGGGFARFGLIANNTARSGGSCHWFDGVQQLIFENNTCDGASLTSEGSNLDTYGCPMQQHAYMHANKVTNTWGYDREVMTFDGDDRHGQNVEGAAVSVSADGLNITLNCVPGRAAPVGGAATTVSGTGAGQVRRIVAIHQQAASPGHGTCVSTFTLDAPFAGPLDNSTNFEFLPFRGENIFENMEYEDVGVFQFYGFAHKNVVAGSVHARTEGVQGWGPNFQSEYVGLVFLDGIRAGHQSGQGGTNHSCGGTHTQAQCEQDLPGSFGDGQQIGGDNLGLMYNDIPGVNRLVVFRENSALSHGGIGIGSGQDILLEGNRVANPSSANMDPPGPLHAASPRTNGILVQNTTRGVVMRNNEAGTMIVSGGSTS